MKRTMILMTVCLAYSSIGSHFTPGLSTENKKKKTQAIEWHAFDKGLELAQQQKKLMVVDIYTDWCHWCKVMDKDTYGNSEVVAFARQNVIMTKLNAETTERFKFKGASYSGRELSMMFGVTGFPTTAFMNDKGELIAKVPGFIPADRFTLILKFLVGRWYEKNMTFDEFVKKEQTKNKS
jgi:thioredoxin-related protein